MHNLTGEMTEEIPHSQLRHRQNPQTLHSDENETIYETDEEHGGVRALAQSPYPPSNTLTSMYEECAPCPNTLTSVYDTLPTSSSLPPWRENDQQYTQRMMPHPLIQPWVEEDEYIQRNIPHQRKKLVEDEAFTQGWEIEQEDYTALRIPGNDHKYAPARTPQTTIPACAKPPSVVQQRQTTDYLRVGWVILLLSLTLLAFLYCVIDTNPSGILYPLSGTSSSDVLVVSFHLRSAAGRLLGPQQTDILIPVDKLMLHTDSSNREQLEILDV
jgi:hypothetical protein